MYNFLFSDYDRQYIFFCGIYYDIESTGNYSPFKEGSKENVFFIISKNFIEYTTYYNIYNFLPA